MSAEDILAQGDTFFCYRERPVLLMKVDNVREIGVWHTHARVAYNLMLENLRRVVLSKLMSIESSFRVRELA